MMKPEQKNETLAVRPEVELMYCLRLTEPTRLGCDHEGSIAIVVLVVDVNKWTFVQHCDNVHRTLGHSHHQSSLTRTQKKNTDLQ